MYLVKDNQILLDNINTTLFKTIKRRYGRTKSVCGFPRTKDTNIFTASPFTITFYNMGEYDSVKEQLSIFFC